MKMHFKDNIHPDVEGSQALAAAIYKKIARYEHSIR
jgi:lysophospholipase L1-like esterase